MGALPKLVWVSEDWAPPRAPITSAQLGSLLVGGWVSNLSWNPHYHPGDAFFLLPSQQIVHSNNRAQLDIPPGHNCFPNWSQAIWNTAQLFHLFVVQQLGHSLWSVFTCLIDAKFHPHIVFQCTGATDKSTTDLCLTLDVTRLPMLFPCPEWYLSLPELGHCLASDVACLTADALVHPFSPLWFWVRSSYLQHKTYRQHHWNRDVGSHQPRIARCFSGVLDPIRLQIFPMVIRQDRTIWLFCSTYTEVDGYAV